jgi:hypothetical protein
MDIDYWLKYYDNGNISTKFQYIDNKIIINYTSHDGGDSSKYITSMRGGSEDKYSHLYHEEILIYHRITL